MWGAPPPQLGPPEAGEPGWALLPWLPRPPEGHRMAGYRAPPSCTRGLRRGLTAHCLLQPQFTHLRPGTHAPQD